MLDQTTQARRAEARPDPLPAWAWEAFPEGLSRQSEGVWAPRNYTWGLAEQARINMAATRRAGAAPSVSQHFEHLLRTAVDRACPDLPAKALVLDLRSGDGARSVAPWLNVLPDARIVASDPASMLLATMVSQAAKMGDEDRVMGVVAEPERVPVAPASFDLVSGIACLHELDDPDVVLAAAARALKPGGYAIFLAPFDGHGILRLAYERICAEAPLWPDAPLGPGVAAGLEALIADIAARTLPDSADPAFQVLEQKWLFSRESLETAARAFGFREVRFLPHNDHETLYRDMAFVHLRLSSGLDSLTLPDWALAILDEFDAALPGPVKRLLMLEGSIVFTKAA